jgi:S-adenosylmethionine hydrolase
MGGPVVALLTDLGPADHRVGAMKSVVAGNCPDATFIDSTHDVPARDVLGLDRGAPVTLRQGPLGLPARRLSV